MIGAAGKGPLYHSQVTGSQDEAQHLGVGYSV